MKQKPQTIKYRTGKESELEASSEDGGTHMLPPHQNDN